MLVKFNTKESRIAEKDLATMEKKVTQRFRRYFAQEGEETVIYIKICDRKLGFKVELTAQYLGYELRAETTDKISAVAALDKATDVLERQIAKCKTKLARSKYATPDFSASLPQIDDLEEEPDIYSVVRIKSYKMKPITVQEAIMEMNMLGHSFYTFLNKETDKVSTVYRRDDGDYGMIEPL
ncbi:MAG: HPF/RaiA family ribosome-associated protein [Ruminococcaceae bacterium]|nr:HPF/RaiA family ribosome-associated protein [Oscillospiraceae bacterium]